jgi:hypothetical protein
MGKYRQLWSKELKDREDEYIEWERKKGVCKQKHEHWKQQNKDEKVT